MEPGDILKKIPQAVSRPFTRKEAPIRQLHTVESGKSEGIVTEGASLASREHPTQNQDAFFVLPDGRGFGVFDGIGGAKAPDVASNMAKDILRQAMVGIPKDCSLEEARKMIEEALIDAHRKILGRGETVPDFAGMSTTATAGYVWERKATGERKLIVGHAGDSRMYRVRGGRLEHITLDDGEIAARFAADPAKIREVQERISRASDPSQLTQEEFALWRKSTAVYNRLGRKGRMTPTILTEDILPGDVYADLSDGVFENTHDQVLLSEIRRGWSTQTKTDGLLGTTDRMSIDPKNPWRKSVHDDATVIIAQFSGEASVANEEQQTVTKVGVAERQKPLTIAAASSMDELRSAIGSLPGGGIQGSTEFYSNERLLQIIDEVRAGQRRLDAITRTGGLRDTVGRLLEQEKRQR